ncbi:MAG TPA: electron transport complex subunit RsxA [Acidiferrobacteraceae bacterium]|nr:electron transport complex subunit RsxA [Acidiferrobacteraceae bacterium]
MKEFALIIVSTVLVNNFVLIKFLGLHPFMGVPRKVEAVISMAIATALALTLSSASSYLLETYLLAPFDLTHLRTLIFILMIAAIVQITVMAVRKMGPVLHQVLGAYLPLITANCAVLGVALLSIQESNGFRVPVTYSFGAALGFPLVLILFSAMGERLEATDVPKPFKGTAIVLITAGLMSMALMGFSGLA